MLIKELGFYSYICDGANCNVQSQQYPEESVAANVKKDGWTIPVDDSGDFCPYCQEHSNTKRLDQSDMSAFAVVK